MATTFCESRARSRTLIPAGLLLALLALSGCRQIPLAPEATPEDRPAMSTAPRDSQPVPEHPATNAVPETVIELVRPAEPASAERLPAPAPSSPAKPLLRPHGGHLASWLPPSKRPSWLQTCLASHQLDDVPRIQRTVMPEYPEKLIRNDVQGRVDVVFQISPTGQLAHTLVRPGAHPTLRQRSVNAMRRWKFSPPTREGQPVAACLTQVFRYVLEE